MRLSLKQYGWKCVLGTEVVYVGCVFYGHFLSGRAYEFHQTFFETFPFFSWSSIWRMIAAGLFLMIPAWIFACYYVWMFNSSLEGGK